MFDENRLNLCTWRLIVTISPPQKLLKRIVGCTPAPGRPNENLHRPKFMSAARLVDALPVGAGAPDFPASAQLRVRRQPVRGAQVCGEWQLVTCSARPWCLERSAGGAPTWFGPPDHDTHRIPFFLLTLYTDDVARGTRGGSVRILLALDYGVLLLLSIHCNVRARGSARV